MKRLITTIMATIALTAPLAAQSLEERAIAVVTQAQLAASAGDAEEKRDRLVAAAWEARRIVEDAPESEIAAQLTGRGFEVFGADPIRHEALQVAMVETCIAAPNALCLTDLYYYVSSKAIAPTFERLLELHADVPLPETAYGDRLFSFRGKAAIAYSELGLSDRVHATYAYHVRNDGRLTRLERAFAAPDFAYAFARVGNMEAAEDVVPEIKQGVGDDETLRLRIEMESAHAPQMLAAGLLAAGQREWFEVLAEEIRPDHVFEALNKAHRWSLSPEIRDAMTRRFKACLALGPFQDRACANELAIVHARVGDLDALRDVASAPEQRGTAKPVAPGGPFMEFLEQGHIDAAREWFRAELSQQVWAMAMLGAISDPQLIATAEEMALAEPDAAARNAHLETIATSLAEAGQMEQAAHFAAKIDDAALRQSTINSFPYFRAYGAVAESDYDAALVEMKKLEPPQFTEVALHMLKHAIRNAAK